MLGRLLLLFLLTPAVELGLLLQVGRYLGFWPTLGLIVATGIAGSFLARREGLQTWRRLNERLSRGDLPGKELVDGVIILVAGALLVTPGVLTDVLGFLGLIPPTRALIRKVLMRRFQSKMKEGSMQIQFGIFGGAAPGPNSSASPSRPSPPGAEPNPSWKGTSRKVPRHSETSSRDADQGPSDDVLTSDRSDGR